MSYLVERRFWKCARSTESQKKKKKTRAKELKNNLSTLYSILKVVDNTNNLLYQAMIIILRYKNNEPITMFLN